MSFIDRVKRYDYMPPGSYAVLPDWNPLFLIDVPDELKERFTRDLKEAQKEKYELMKDPKAFLW